VKSERLTDSDSGEPTEADRRCDRHRKRRMITWLPVSYCAFTGDVCRMQGYLTASFEKLSLKLISEKLINTYSVDKHRVNYDV